MFVIVKFDSELRLLFLRWVVSFIGLDHAIQSRLFPRLNELYWHPTLRPLRIVPMFIAVRDLINIGNRTQRDWYWLRLYRPRWTRPAMHSLGSITADQVVDASINREILIDLF